MPDRNIAGWATDPWAWCVGSAATLGSRLAPDSSSPPPAQRLSASFSASSNSMRASRHSSSTFLVHAAASSPAVISSEREPPAYTTPWITKLTAERETGCPAATQSSLTERASSLRLTGCSRSFAASDTKTCRNCSADSAGTSVTRVTCSSMPAGPRRPARTAPAKTASRPRPSQATAWTEYSNAVADLGDPGPELAVAAPVGLQRRVRREGPVRRHGPGDRTRRGPHKGADLVGGRRSRPRCDLAAVRSVLPRSGGRHHAGDLGRGPVEDGHEVVRLHHAVGHLPVRERHGAGGDHRRHPVGGPEPLDQRREVRVGRRDEELLNMGRAGQGIHRVQHQVDVGAGLAPLGEGGAVDHAEARTGPVRPVLGVDHRVQVAVADQEAPGFLARAAVGQRLRPVLGILGESLGGGRVQGHQAGVDVVEVHEHRGADAGPPGLGERIGHRLSVPARAGDVPDVTFTVVAFCGRAELVGQSG